MARALVSSLASSPMKRALVGGEPRTAALAAEALGLVFGSNMPPITANKGQIGHSVAASGALSIACAIEVARRGAIPAAGDYALARACADVDLVRGAPREAGVRRVCVHAAGLGGQTTCIALEIDP